MAKRGKPQNKSAEFLQNVFTRNCLYSQRIYRVDFFSRSKCQTHLQVSLKWSHVCELCVWVVWVACSLIEFLVNVLQMRGMLELMGIFLIVTWQCIIHMLTFEISCHFMDWRPLHVGLILKGKNGSHMKPVTLLGYRSKVTWQLIPCVLIEEWIQVKKLKIIVLFFLIRAFQNNWMVVTVVCLPVNMQSTSHGDQKSHLLRWVYYVHVLPEGTVGHL